jgi:DNA-binding transcriptional LysR family regulator
LELIISKIDRILTFIQVIEANSFIAASKKLGISNAAVSKQISLLEEELGVLLLHRSTRKLSLTEAGAMYFELSKKMVDNVKEMDNLISEVKGEPMGQLKVVSQRHFGEEFIVPYLKDFLLGYPKIRLNLGLGEYIPDLEKEGIDILIGMSIPTSLNEIQKKIGTTHYIMCASPEYLKKYGRPTAPKDMLKHHYINHAIRRPVNYLKFKDNEEILLEPYLLLNDTRAMRESAIQGLGIVKLHAYVVNEAIAEGKLVEVLKNYAEPIQPIYVSYPAQRIVPPKIRTFINYFVNKFQTRQEKSASSMKSQCKL